MKKLLIAFCSVAVCLAAMAQGMVNFQNSAGTAVRYATTADVPAALQGQLAGIAGGPLTADWLVSLHVGNGPALGANGTFNFGNGRFGAGTRDSGVAAGTQVTFFVKAWSSAGGTYTSYEAALASGLPSVYAGKSGPILVTVTVPPSGPGQLTGLGSGFTGVTVAPVPEPSIVALGLLGAAALLIRRRN